MKIERDPGTPVLFRGFYGEHRFGVTDGKVGTYWRVIEFDPDEPVFDYTHLVHEDDVVFDPEHSETFDPPRDNLERMGYSLLGLPLMVAGCIAFWVGLFMLFTGDLKGILGFVLCGVVWYWTWLLYQDEGGE